MPAATLHAMPDGSWFPICPVLQFKHEAGVPATMRLCPHCNGARPAEIVQQIMLLPPPAPPNETSSSALSTPQSQRQSIVSQSSRTAETTEPSTLTSLSSQSSFNSRVAAVADTERQDGFCRKTIPDQNAGSPARAPARAPDPRRVRVEYSLHSQIIKATRRTVEYTAPGLEGRFVWTPTEEELDVSPGFVDTALIDKLVELAENNSVHDDLWWKRLWYRHDVVKRFHDGFDKETNQPRLITLNIKWQDSARLQLQPFRVARRANMHPLWKAAILMLVPEALAVSVECPNLSPKPAINKAIQSAIQLDQDAEGDDLPLESLAWRSDYGEEATSYLYHPQMTPVDPALGLQDMVDDMQDTAGAADEAGSATEADSSSSVVAVSRTPSPSKAITASRQSCAQHGSSTAGGQLRGGSLERSNLPASQRHTTVPPRTGRGGKRARAASEQSGRSSAEPERSHNLRKQPRPHYGRIRAR